MCLYLCYLLASDTFFFPKCFLCTVFHIDSPCQPYISELHDSYGPCYRAESPYNLTGIDRDGHKLFCRQIPCRDGKKASGIYHIFFRGKFLQKKIIFFAIKKETIVKDLITKLFLTT